ncbi:sugar transferase [Cutibacterium sp. WCA-380-WT-3A]|uniref:Sugar transferase n=1 Tax=Cutibacterium porci TaxID=2605781 RepID=A0A7K0J4J9_9ACTN|nr:sugar transferase [Cutibacterium porci]
MHILVADFIITTLASFIAVQARTTITTFPKATDVQDNVIPWSGGIIAAWLVIMAACGAYRTEYLDAGMAQYRAVLEGSTITAALLGISAYLFMYPLSRGFYFLLFLFSIPALLLERFFMRRWLHHERYRGRFRRNVIIAGDCDHIDDLAKVLQREMWLGYDVIGVLTREKARRRIGSVPVLGEPKDVKAVCQRTQAEAVIFTEGSFSRAYQFNRLARALEGQDTELIVVPALSDISTQRIRISPTAGMPLVHIEKPQAERAAGWFKRSFDIVGSLILLIVTSPIILTAAIAIKHEDGGPVFYKQRRVGRKGKIFECYKLRSMVVNADEIKAKMLADKNESDGVLFKIKDDPRITKCGKFHRRYSIDEIPQFYNVLRGDMSLVGPRPALENEVAAYESHVHRRLDVRPGVTGLWQVSGRSDLSWEDTVRLDLYYVDNWSILQDVNILAKTLRAVFSSSGAY